MESYGRGGSHRGRGGGGRRDRGRGRWNNQQFNEGGSGSSSRAATSNPPAQQWVNRPGSGQGGTTGPSTHMGYVQNMGPTRPDSGEGSTRGGYGRGRGVWSGRGWGQQAYVQSQTSSESVPDSVISEMQLLKVSEQVPPSSPPESINRVLPIKRPDNGGSLATRKARLLVNHFPVKFNPDSVIRHYDVNIEPEVPPKHGRPVKIPKSNLHMIRDKLFSDDPTLFPMLMSVYDGEKNIFSAVPLHTGKFKVEFSEAEDMKIRSYTFTIKLVNELQLCKLKDYLSGKVLSIPRDILQGMDLVMKENPARRMISIGRCFFPPEFLPKDDLGNGIAAFRGFQHSLKLTSQGPALCLDYSVLPLWKRMPVIDFLVEHVYRFNLNDIIRVRREEVQGALKGLKVTVTHRITKQKYTIAGLTDQNTRDLLFTVEDPEGKDPPRQVGLVDYFRNKYGKDIIYKDIPCLDLGKNNRKNYVPMEFCELVEGQRYPKENLDKKAADKLKKISLAPPEVRKNIICDMVRSTDGPCGGDVTWNFGIEVNMNMTPVMGRIMRPPELKLGGKVNRVTVDNKKCQWNLVGKSVVEGKAIERWAVLDFSSYERFDKLDPDQFISKLIERCRNLGMRMEKPLFYQPERMNVFSNVAMLHKLLKNVNDEAYKFGKGRLQILVCVMARKDPGYKYLKWISETRIGIVTQCCLSSSYLASKAPDQHLANIALKINAKLGGSNVELIDRFPRFEGEGHVMFVGADVNHPGPFNSTSPSIAAVVATINWPAANRYAARIRPQYHRTEMILNFGDMCRELIETYARFNNIKPKKIVVFRDGVSEGQFDMVLNEELIDLKRAIQTANYSPTITFIVAQKRHQTRLFPDSEIPDSERDWGSTGNVSPGTVVDTKIVHPFEFDFYLCSHYGSIGTSKPTHYYVLWDEHTFTSDQLQQLIYNLCFTFARCTKPVSLVTPVYYADLVAYRGRMYQEALLEGQSSGSVPSSSSSLASSSLSPAASFDERFYKLHGELENIMFFV